MKIFSQLSKFRRLLGPRVWRLFVFSVLMGLAWFLVETFFVYVLQAFMVSVGLIDAGKTPVSRFPFMVENALWCLLIFGLLRAVVGYLKGYLLTISNYVFLTEQRQNVFSVGLRSAHLLGMNDLLSLFGETIYTSSIFLQYLILTLSSLISTALFFAFGLTQAPIEMLLGFLMLAIFMLPLKKLSRKISAAGQGTNHEWESVNAALISGLKNHFLLNVYRQTEPEISAGHRRLESYLKHGKVHARGFNLMNVFPVFVGIAVISSLTYISQKFTGTPPMTLVAFFYIFIRFSQGASESNASFASMRFNQASFLRLLNFSETSAHREPRSLNAPAALEPLETLEAKDLTFGYQGSPLFENLHFQLSAGHSLAIVGESGSGKSTLLSIVLGLLRPDGGNIQFNHQTATDFGSSYFEQIGYIGPEPFIIETSVRENLLFGHPRRTEVQEDQLWQALKICCLDSEIKGLKSGLDHLLNASQRLSTGQKQRLSIARAVLRRPNLFVFDEGTANLDSETERQVLANIRSDFPRALSIFVTHRRDLASQADAILYIGSERGTSPS